MHTDSGQFYCRGYDPLFIILQERTTSQAAFTRATVVIAVKYSMVERPENIDEIIYPEITSFLMLIKDHDRVIFVLLRNVFSDVATSSLSYYSFFNFLVLYFARLSFCSIARPTSGRVKL